MSAKRPNVNNLLTVGLDMDGVILDSTRSKIAFAKKLGYTLTPEETQADCIGEAMAAEDLETLRHFLYQDPVTGLRADVVDGARNGIARLKTENIPYYLISRRKNTEIAKGVLKKRGLWPVYFDETNTFFVEKAEDKDAKAAELGVQVYLDDQPSILRQLTSVPRRFLFDRFRSFEGLDFAHTRVADWNEFLSKIL